MSRRQLRKVTKSKKRGFPGATGRGRVIKASHAKFSTFTRLVQATAQDDRRAHEDDTDTYSLDTPSYC